MHSSLTVHKMNRVGILKWHFYSRFLLSRHKLESSQTRDFDRFSFFLSTRCFSRIDSSFRVSRIVVCNFKTRVESGFLSKSASRKAVYIAWSKLMSQNSISENGWHFQITKYQWKKDTQWDIYVCATAYKHLYMPCIVYSPQQPSAHPRYRRKVMESCTRDSPYADLHIYLYSYSYCVGLSESCEGTILT